LGCRPSGPDVTIAPDGSLTPLVGLSAMVGLVAHPYEGLDLYAYAGREQVNANFFGIGTNLFGYGNPGFSNVGCETATPFSFASVTNIPANCITNNRRLQSRDGEANAAESGYFAARGLLAKSVAEAARFIAERGVLAEGSPVLVRFIAQIASRFGVVVTQKLAAQAVPVIGALGGAAVNYAFIDHFQEVARAHFVVRRLERRYGKSAVRAAYERFCCETQAAA